MFGATEETSVWHSAKRKWQSPLPDGSLRRTRLAAVVIAGLAFLSEFGQLGNALRSPQYTRLAGACIIAIFLILVVTYRRGRATWWSAALLPVLVAVGGAGLNDPVASTALAMASTSALSLYGSTPLWVARVAGALISVPAATAISPSSGDRVMTWDSPTVLGVLPQLLLMSVLTRGIYLSLLRQERAAAREALLARAGLAMLGATDVEEIRSTGRRVAGELVALAPGVVLLVLRRRPGGLLVTTAAGVDGVRGRELNAGVVHDPAALGVLLPEFRVWRVDSLGVDPATADVYIAVGGRRRIPCDVLDAFRNLSHQVVLAEKVSRALAELDHRAHHDHLTQLPTRAKFLRAVDDAVAGAGRGVVAVLNVDLDDFKQVNDGYGHAAGDELLVEVAERMGAVAEGRGLAARLGGDEFAVLLTGLADAEEAERIAALLCTTLAAPVNLSAATVTVGASIGVAVAEPGVTVAELTRRADAAMYAAKAAGKNRIESFPPPQPHLAA